MAGVLQGQPGGGQTAETQSGDEMMAGAKTGNLLLQPRDHLFTDEVAKLIVAGAVLFAGLWAGLAWNGNGVVPLLVSGSVAAVVGIGMLRRPELLGQVVPR